MKKTIEENTQEQVLLMKAKKYGANSKTLLDQEFINRLIMMRNISKSN